MIRAFLYSRKTYFKLAAISVAALLMIQCSGGGKTSGQFVAGPNAKRYELKGTVVSINRKAKKAEIDHAAIPGFMEAMSMEFKFKDDWVWDVLKVGSKVTATLVVDNQKGDFWLEDPSIVQPSEGGAGAPPRDDVAVVGKKIIDFSLTDENGKPISPNEFSGKAWALTFIYTECPLPNYCILMSQNFSDVANKVAEDPALSKRIGLLSISFDPTKDTPEKLRKYGLGYLGKDSKAADFSVWKLAVGKDAEVKKVADFFGLRYEVDKNDQTKFNHSLRTIVIGPDGTIKKVFSGNDWTKAELLDQLKAALK